jgi:hypothetical protein
LRGKQTRVKDSEQIDKWWASVLKSVNSVEKAILKKDLQSKGKSVIDAIVLDDDASVVEHHDDKLKEQKWILGISSRKRIWPIL